MPKLLCEIKRAWLRLTHIPVIPVTMHSWPSKQLEYVNAFIENGSKSIQYALYYLRHGEGYVFIVVRWFVCLPVNNITEKRLNGFSCNFQGRWDLMQGTNGNVFRMFYLTPWTQKFFPTFSESLSSIAEKRSNGFSWHFPKRTDMTQAATVSICGMLRLTPWILGRFIYFLDPCLFVILWKNGWMDFHEIFMKRQERHKK